LPAPECKWVEVRSKWLAVVLAHQQKARARKWKWSMATEWERECQREVQAYESP
jgi:hypothetical protein